MGESFETKISIIMPMYNASKNLRLCLDSVRDQSFRDYELIIVDDGSTDDSCEIVSSYMANDSRISLYHQQNQYAGVARNNGMTHAKGEYLIFWDSDDYFHVDALRLLYEKIKEDDAEICICNAAHFLDDKKITAPGTSYLKREMLPDFSPFAAKDIPEYILNFTSPVTWNKLFKKSYIDEIGARFEARRNVNDAYFVALALCQASRITTVDRELIYYRKNQKGSLVSTLSMANLSPYEAWINIKNELLSKGIFPEKSFANRALTIVVYHLHNTASYKAFCDSVNYLKREGLRELSLYVRDDYYDSEWRADCLSHLINDSVEEFLAFFAYNTYVQLFTSDAKRFKIDKKYKKLDEKFTRYEEKSIKKIDDLNLKIEELSSKNESLKKKLSDVRNSKSYKIGRVITYIPRGLFGRKKGS